MGFNLALLMVAALQFQNRQEAVGWSFGGQFLSTFVIISRLSIHLIHFHSVILHQTPYFAIESTPLLRSISIKTDTLIEIKFYQNKIYVANIFLLFQAIAKHNPQHRRTIDMKMLTAALLVSIRLKKRRLLKMTSA